MAEADCNLADDNWEQPTMPHLDYGQAELDQLFPSMVAPDDLDDGAEEAHDNQDMVFQTGLTIAEGIARNAVDHGRRRCLRASDGT
jgi:hypothetical protein